MSAVERLGIFFEKNFVPPTEAETYDQFLAFTQHFGPKTITATPASARLELTPQERSDGIVKAGYAILFRATTQKGRRISYNHTCGQLRASDPNKIDTRSRMVPDWDIRKVVVQRFLDATDRTYLTAFTMLQDIRQRMPQAEVILKRGGKTISEEELSEERKSWEERRLYTWPGTPSV